MISTLAMSDEIAQDEEDAEDYDLEAIESRTRARDEEDDDDITLVGRRAGHDIQSVGEDHVVFEIGDEEEEEDPITPKRRKADRVSVERLKVSVENNSETEGLMAGDEETRRLD